jgi:hypothetical protein
MGQVFKPLLLGFYGSIAASHISSISQSTSINAACPILSPRPTPRPYYTLTDPHPVQKSRFYESGKHDD